MFPTNNFCYVSFIDKMAAVHPCKHLFGQIFLAPGKYLTYNQRAIECQVNFTIISQSFYSYNLVNGYPVNARLTRKNKLHKFNLSNDT